MTDRREEQDESLDGLLGRAVEALRQSPIPPGPPPEAVNRVLAAVRGDNIHSTTNPNRTRYMIRIVRIAAAASILAALTVLVVWVAGGSNNIPSRPWPSAGQLAERDFRYFPGNKERIRRRERNGNGKRILPGPFARPDGDFGWERRKTGADEARQECENPSRKGGGRGHVRTQPLWNKSRFPTGRRTNT